MGNHYHLILRLLEPELSRALQWLNVSYGGYFNRRHRRSGHLFQGRFHAVLVEPESLWEVIRYVHLNPVRIQALGLGKKRQVHLSHGLGVLEKNQLNAWLKTLRTSRQTSYLESIGQQPAPKWLKVDWWRGGKKARDRYRSYVEEAVRYGTPESPWEKIRGQAILGSAEFFEKMRNRVGKIKREQPATKEFLLKCTPKQIREWVQEISGRPAAQWMRQRGAWERNLYLLGCRKLARVKLLELAEETGLDYASVSQACGRTEKRAEKEAPWKGRWQQLKQLSISKM
jgi:putative transposase